MKNTFLLLVILIAVFSSCHNPKQRNIVTVNDTSLVKEIPDTDFRPVSYKKVDDTLVYTGTPSIIKLINSCNNTHIFDNRKIISSDSFSTYIDVSANYKLTLPNRYKLSFYVSAYMITTRIGDTEVKIRVREDKNILTYGYAKTYVSRNCLLNEISYNKVYAGYHKIKLEGGGDSGAGSIIMLPVNITTFKNKNGILIKKCQQEANIVGYDYESDYYSSDAEAFDVWVYAVSLSAGEHLALLNFTNETEYNEVYQEIIHEVLDSISFLDTPDAQKYFGYDTIYYPFNYSESIARDSWIQYTTKFKEFTMLRLGHNERPCGVTYKLCSSNFRKNTFSYSGQIHSPSRHSFSYGPYLPKDYYENMPYETGFYAPPDHFTWTEEGLNDTYNIYNVVPMFKQYKEGLWSACNNMILHWLEKYNSLYVITSASHKKEQLIKNSPLRVPIYFTTVVIDFKANQAIGFMLPHDSTITNFDLKDYAYSIDSLETMIPGGIQLVKAFPLSNVKQFKSKLDFEYWFE